MQLPGVKIQLNKDIRLAFFCSVMIAPEKKLKLKHPVAIFFIPI